MPDLPTDIAALPDEHGCADLLARAVWPDGFRCDCGETRHYRLRTRPRVFACGRCHRQRSVTAGCVLHKTKLPLRIWFTAMLLMARPGGVSAAAFARMANLRYDTAWRLLHKLRLASADPVRTLVHGAVEVVSLPLRTRCDGTDRRSRRISPIIGLVPFVAMVTAGKGPPRVVTLHRRREPHPNRLVVAMQLAPHERARKAALGVRDAIRRTYQAVGVRWLRSYLLEQELRLNHPVAAELVETLTRRLVTTRWCGFSGLADHEARAIP